MNKKAQIDYFVIWIFRIFLIAFVFYSVVNFASSRMNFSFDFTKVRGRFLLDRLYFSDFGFMSANGEMGFCDFNKLNQLSFGDNYRNVFDSDNVGAEVVSYDLITHEYRTYYINENFIKTYMTLYGKSTAYAYDFDRRLCIGPNSDLYTIGVVLIYPKDD